MFSSGSSSRKSDYSGYYLLTSLNLAVLSMRPTTEPVNNTRRAGESSPRANKPSQAPGLLANQVCEDAEFDARAMRDGARQTTYWEKLDVRMAGVWKGAGTSTGTCLFLNSLSLCFELALSALQTTTRSEDHLVNCGLGYRHRMLGVGPA